MTNSNTKDQRSESIDEEIANSITHGLGIILSIIGLVVLIVYTKASDRLVLVSCIIYGSSLILLYSASTFYHVIQKPSTKKILQVFDHSAIYILIAGTYTPFTLISLKGAWGWSIFGAVWALAISGISLKLFFFERFQKISTIFYIVMGWIIIFAIKPLVTLVPRNGLFLIFAGGLFYSLGSIFMGRNLKYSHTLWHIFVLLGSICHFFAIFFYVIP